MTYIFRKLKKTIVTGFLCATVICGSVFPQNSDKYTSANSRILRDRQINDTRLTDLDKKILDKLYRYNQTGNALAVYTIEKGIVVFVSGGSKFLASKLANEIRDALNISTVEGIGLEDIILDLNSNNDVITRLRALYERAIFPNNSNEQLSRLDDIIIDKLKEYAESILQEIDSDVYGQSALRLSSSFLSLEAYRQQYYAFSSAIDRIKSLSPGDKQNKLVKWLIYLNLASTVNSGIDSEDKEGFSWLKRALHTEIQLQYFLRKKKLTLVLDKAILSAFRPCPSCARMPATRHWCQEPSRTPFYCVSNDSPSHTLDQTELTKETRAIAVNGNPTKQIYLVTLPKEQ